MQRNHAMHSDVPAQYIYPIRPVFIWRGQHLKNVKVVSQLIMCLFSLIMTYRSLKHGFSTDNLMDCIAVVM